MTTDICSKCKAVLDTTGNPKWCKACRAAYQRDYQDGKTERGEAKGYARGVRAMRDLLADEFGKQGGGMFSGDECALLIRQAPGPKLEA